jgi:hypothetical protein
VFEEAQPAHVRGEGQGARSHRMRCTRGGAAAGAGLDGKVQRRRREHQWGTESAPGKVVRMGAHHVGPAMVRRRRSSAAAVVSPAAGAQLRRWERGMGCYVVAKATACKEETGGGLGDRCHTASGEGGAACCRLRTA